MDRPAQRQPSTPAADLLPPNVDAVGTRRQLLETALVLFAERGYHGVSVRDITGAIGIKVSSLYAHFASKEDLLAALHRAGLAHHLTELRAALAGAGPEPAERLRALVEAHVAINAEAPLLVRVCTEDVGGLSEPNLQAVLADRLEIIGLFVDVISEGIDAGTFARTDPFLASMAILAMGIRVAYWYGSNAAGLEFSAVLGTAPAANRRFTVDELTRTYAELALKMVRVA